MSGGALQVAAVVALHQPNPPFNGGGQEEKKNGVCVWSMSADKGHQGERKSWLNQLQGLSCSNAQIAAHTKPSLLNLL